MNETENPIKTIFHTILSVPKKEEPRLKTGFALIAIFSLVAFILFILFDKSHSIFNFQDFNYMLYRSLILGAQCFFGGLWVAVLLLSIKRKTFLFIGHLLFLPVMCIAFQLLWKFSSFN